MSDEDMEDLIRELLPRLPRPASVLTPRFHFYRPSEWSWDPPASDIEKFHADTRVLVRTRTDDDPSRRRAPYAINTAPRRWRGAFKHWPGKDIKGRPTSMRAFASPEELSDALIALAESPDRWPPRKKLDVEPNKRRALRNLLRRIMR